MMKTLLRAILLSLAVFILPLGLFAQDKTLAYYNSHESEILPDAQAAFKNGNYSRTLELCRWHYIIFGDDSAYALRDKADRCSKLADEMNQLMDSGQVKEAKLKANAILSLNPEDSVAKATLMLEESVLPVQDTIVVALPKDTVQVEKPVIEEVPQTNAVEEKPEEIILLPVEENPFDQPIVEQETANHAPVTPYKPHTRFVVKASASVLDLKQIARTVAPGGSIGLYDWGGSRMGIEAGGYVCPGLSSVSASLIGMDAGLVVRAAKSIYPKLGIGFFSCKSTDQSDSATQGLCAGAGITFLLGGHLSFEIGAKYYPVVKVSGIEIVSTAGASYEYPVAKAILSGGIAPGIHVGWAF